MTIAADIITILGLVDANADTAKANLEAAGIRAPEALWIRRTVGGKTWKLGYSVNESGNLIVIIKERG